MKFEPPALRDQVLDLIFKARLKFDCSRIWSSADLPFPLRVEEKFLFGMKRLLSPWEWQSIEVQVDLEPGTLYMFNEAVALVRAMHKVFKMQFHKDWKERLKDDKPPKVCHDAKKQLAKRNIGKGTGRSS